MVGLQDFLSGFGIAGASEGIVVRGETEMAELAAFLTGFARPGLVIALYGDLGAGKTTFARHFTQAMGASDRVSSPTFTILHEYLSGRMPVFHFDLYRISDPGEVLEFAEEYFYGQGVCLVEWPENAGDLIPEDAIRLRLAYGDEEDERVATFGEARGDSYDSDFSGKDAFSYMDDEFIESMYSEINDIDEDFSI